MKMRILPARLEIPSTNPYAKLLLVATLLFFGAFSVSRVNAQQKLSKRYPVSKNVRIELKNISGTITVESWSRGYFIMPTFSTSKRS